MLFWIVKFLIFIPFRIIFPTFVKNRRKMPKGKCIIIANHIGAWDPVILINAFWKNQHFLGKKELLNSKFKTWFYLNCKVIPVDRENVGISTLKKCFKVLESGASLSIFPEGTRNKTDQPLLPIKSGTAMFAIKTNTPIVPIWISKKPKPFRFNKIVVGDAFYLTKEQNAEADEIIKNNLLKTKEMLN